MLLDTHGKAARPPNKVLMHQKHMPYSTGPTFMLSDEQMRTWWSADGKRLMLDIVHFLSIVNKHNKSNAKAVWWRMKNGKTKIKRDFKFMHIDEGPYGKDIMDIADLLELLVEKHIPYMRNFPEKDADPFRDTIIATLTAHEAHNTVMHDA